MKKLLLLLFVILGKNSKNLLPTPLAIADGGGGDKVLHLLLQSIPSYSDKQTSLA